MVEDFFQVKPKEYYELCQNLLRIFGVGFALLGTTLGFLSTRYSKKIDLAKKMESSWKDDNPNSTAIRVWLSPEELRWKNFVLGIEKKAIDGYWELVMNQNFIEGDAETYLPIGVYRLTIKKDGYEEKSNIISVTAKEIGVRMGMTYTLERKMNLKP